MFSVHVDEKVEIGNASDLFVCVYVCLFFSSAFGFSAIFLNGYLYRTALNGMCVGCFFHSLIEDFMYKRMKKKQ